VTLATITLRVPLLNQSIEVTVDRARTKEKRPRHKSKGRAWARRLRGFPMGVLTTQRLKRTEEFLESYG
jgi:hypothetical protein